MSQTMLIDCPKCQGDMGARKLPRMGSGLGLLGAILLGCGILAALVSIPVLTVGLAFAELDEGLPSLGYEIALDELADAEGVPQDVCDEFERKHDVSAERLAELPEDVRDEVETILSDYRETDFLSFDRFKLYGQTMLVAGLPAVIIGFVLARKRKIWLCLDCGFEQDR